MGGDPGVIAQTIITWYGSGAGGRFLLLGILIACIPAAMHLCSWRTPAIGGLIAVVAWTASFALRTWMGWAI